MENNIKELYDFIDKAIKNRKYPPTTGQVLRAAIKSFDEELTDEERNSINKFKDNIDHIVATIYNKKGDSVSASSLSTYKSRALKVIADYEKYGTDPSKMANWTPPKPVLRKKKANKSNEVNDSNREPNNSEDIAQNVPNEMHKMDLQLRPGVKFTFILPYDLKIKEVAKINAVLKSLATDEGNDDNAGLQETSTE